jgi:hypothetical protein
MTQASKPGTTMHNEVILMVVRANAGVISASSQAETFAFGAPSR